MRSRGRVPRDRHARSAGRSSVTSTAPVSEAFSLSHSPSRLCQQLAIPLPHPTASPVTPAHPRRGRAVPSRPQSDLRNSSSAPRLSLPAASSQSTPGDFPARGSPARVHAPIQPPPRVKQPRAIYATPVRPPRASSTEGESAWETSQKPPAAFPAAWGRARAATPALQWSRGADTGPAPN